MLHGWAALERRAEVLFPIGRAIPPLACPLCGLGQPGDGMCEGGRTAC